MALNLNKPLRTRSGASVEIVTINGRGPHPIKGYIGDSDELTGWAIDGSYSTYRSASDLINVEDKHVRYLNMYSNEAHAHRTRDGAITARGNTCLATIRVVFTEGQIDE